jgi:t-SNARE complex subunit (syntaxin)
MTGEENMGAPRRKPSDANLLLTNSRISEAVSVFVQHEVDEIEKDLAKFNEQINQIENSGRQDPTIELLKEQAIHIDELRCSLYAKN